MNRVGRFLVVLVILGFGLPAFAGGRGPVDRDKTAIRHVIAGQIEAFQQDNGAAALGYSAPQLRARYQNAADFLRMVRHNYPPVYRPSQISFGPLDNIGGGAKVQHVLVVGDDGNTHVALYVMEREKDGKWLIAGCFLVESNLVAV